MAKHQKEVHKVKMTDGKKAIIQQLFQEYDIESTSDIQDALKDLLGGTIKEMMEAEMDRHLGYEKSQRSANENARNGYKSKTLNSSYGRFRIEVPQDRQSSFEPRVIKSGRIISLTSIRKSYLCTPRNDHETDFQNNQ